MHPQVRRPKAIGQVRPGAPAGFLKIVFLSLELS
jgi:hypothetical protein